MGTAMKYDHTMLMSSFITEIDATVRDGESTVMLLKILIKDSIEAEIIIARLYVMFHTLGVQAGYLHLNNIEQVALASENLCEKLLRQPASLSLVSVDFFERAILTIKDTIDFLVSHGTDSVIYNQTQHILYEHVEFLSLFHALKVSFSQLAVTEGGTL